MIHYLVVVSYPENWQSWTKLMYSGVWLWLRILLTLLSACSFHNLDALNSKSWKWPVITGAREWKYLLHQNSEKWAALSFETNAFKWSRSFIPLSIIIGRDKFVTSKAEHNFWYYFQLLIPVPNFMLKTAIGCFHWNKLGEGDTVFLNTEMGWN